MAISTLRSRERGHEPIPKGPAAMPALVDRLHDLAEDRETVSLNDIVRTIGAQGHAPLLLVAAIFMVLPIGMIPGVGGALGALVALIGLQMLLGHRGVSLPKFLGKRQIAATRISGTAERIRPAFCWLRRHLHIRWEGLARGRISMSVIAVILMLSGGSLLILGAIPIAAPLVGLPIALFAFGLLARDGVVVACGYVLIVVVIGGMVAFRLVA